MVWRFQLISGSINGQFAKLFSVQCISTAILLQNTIGAFIKDEEKYKDVFPNKLKVSFLSQLEGFARYAGRRLGLWRGFLCCLGKFLAIFGVH